MRTALHILGLCAAAIALLSVPVLHASRTGLEVSGMTCSSGCCSHQESAGAKGCCQIADHNPSSKEASETPCHHECGQCPCCVPTPAPLLAIDGCSGWHINLDCNSWLNVGDDLLASRSDEPLLPPPRC